MNDSGKDRGLMFGIERESRLNNGIYIERDKMKPIQNSLLNPNYQDDRFRQRRYDGKVGERVNLTVFLDSKLDEKKIRVEQGSASGFDLAYEYGDRLQQNYGKEAVTKAWDEVDKLNFPEGSAASYEAYLRFLTGNKKIDIKHIVTYVDLEGWGKRIYGYKR